MASIYNGLEERSRTITEHCLSSIVLSETASDIFMSDCLSRRFRLGTTPWIWPRWTENIFRNTYSWLMVGHSSKLSSPLWSEGFLTFYTKHSQKGPLLFPSSGCQIRRIYQTFPERRKHGLSIFQSEIFHRPYPIEQDCWQLFFLHFSQFPRNLLLPRRLINSKDRSMPTHCKASSNSSLNWWKPQLLKAYQLIVLMARFRLPNLVKLDRRPYAKCFAPRNQIKHLSQMRGPNRENRISFSASSCLRLHQIWPLPTRKWDPLLRDLTLPGYTWNTWYQDWRKPFSWLSWSFATSSAQAGYATYCLFRTLQAYDGLDTRISQQTCPTTSVWQCLESFAPLPWILCPQKDLSGGHIVVRSRDEESWVLLIGSSHRGIKAAW